MWAEGELPQGGKRDRLTEGGDTELELVYYLFHKHHWTPEMYYGMGQGGRDLTLAFALHELEKGREPR